MKKFLLLVLIAVLMLSVRATPTAHFSRYDPTCTIEAGNSLPSKAWALYLSEALRETGRDMGKNILLETSTTIPK